tara:strand:- start:32 stop:310 length:279 start_codon:yes stop_codon:yes gene_type:complete
MKNRIIEICELGQPKSIIHRENEPITELIKTDSLIEELNQQLLLHNVSQQRELLIAFHEFLQANYCLQLFDSGKIKLIEEFEATKIITELNK